MSESAREREREVCFYITDEDSRGNARDESFPVSCVARSEVFWSCLDCGYSPTLLASLLFVVPASHRDLICVHSCESSGKKMKTYRITEQLSCYVAGIARMYVHYPKDEIYKRERHSIARSEQEIFRKCVLQLSFTFLKM